MSIQLYLKIKLIIIFALISSLLGAQTDTLLNYRQIHFVKLNQANDLFTYWFQSDRNFSDGVNIEVAHRVFNNKIADRILIGCRNTQYKDFSLSINQDMFTPKNTQTTELNTIDRPYTALLYFTYSKYSNNFWKGKKLVSRLLFGIQGPTALGKEAQNTVHEMIDNPLVYGWDNQLNNGLMLDYEIQFIQEIPITTSFTELHGFSKLQLGTIYNYVELGFRYKIGRYTDTYMNFYGIANPKYKHNLKIEDIAKFNKFRKKIIPKRIRVKSAQEQISFLNKKLNRKFQLYFFTEAMSRFMVRDGTVEGSLITFKKNNYRFYYNDYEHLNFIGRYGFVFQYSRFYMEYMRYLEKDVYNITDVFGYGRIIISYVF